MFTFRNFEIKRELSEENDFTFGKAKEPEKTPEEIAAEEEAAKAKEKTPEEIAAEKAAAEENEKTPEEIAAEEAAAAAEAKTPEEIEAEKKEAEEAIQKRADDEGKTVEEIKEVIASEEAAANAEDIFSFEPSTGDDNKPVFDIKGLSEDFGIEAETPEDFKSKMKDKIESSKQEFKIDSYTPDAQKVIKHLSENGGTVNDFFNNKEIAEYQGVKAMPDAAKVLTVKSNQFILSGMSEQAAREKAQEEIDALSTRELKDASDNINQQADNLIKAEIEKIVGNRESVIAQQKEQDELKTKTEINNLKSFVSKQKDFLGIPLPEKTIENIVQEIDSGKFDEIANSTPAESKFSAYMMNKFGDKVLSTIKGKMAEENRKGKNAAIQKENSALHNTKQTSGSKSTGHSNESKPAGKLTFGNEFFEND